jgi:hypothetical protein
MMTLYNYSVFNSLLNCIPVYIDLDLVLSNIFITISLGLVYSSVIVIDLVGRSLINYSGKVVDLISKGVLTGVGVAIGKHIGSMVIDNINKGNTGGNNTGGDSGKDSNVKDNSTSSNGEGSNKK